MSLEFTEEQEYWWICGRQVQKCGVYKDIPTTAEEAISWWDGFSFAVCEEGEEEVEKLDVHLVNALRDYPDTLSLVTSISR